MLLIARGRRRKKSRLFTPPPTPFSEEVPQMNRQRKCRHCHKLFLPNPRSYNAKNVSFQHYCGEPACRQVSRRQSHKKHVRNNPHYRQKMLRAGRRWRKKNRVYWSKRREKKPGEVRRNRLLQRRRDKKAKSDLANINTIGALCVDKLHRIDTLVDLANINTIEVSWMEVSEEILAYLRWFSPLANIKAIGNLRQARHNSGHETAI